MQWKLNQVEPTECTLDNSGVYTIISRCSALSGQQIRLDIMSSDDEPLQSFIGDGNDVRKAVIDWIDNYYLASDPVTGNISTEHASYIGYEIARAMADENYVQD
jgi:hypothetical protein